MTSSTRALVAVVSRLVKLMTMRPALPSTLIVPKIRPPALRLEPSIVKFGPATRVKTSSAVGRGVAVHAERGAGIVAVAAVARVEVDVGDGAGGQDRDRGLLGRRDRAARGQHRRVVDRGDVHGQHVRARIGIAVVVGDGEGDRAERRCRWRSGRP